ncbi:MAG: AAA family ATPase [Candidatus Paceibacterota bacterium]|jgi:predicted ATP-dependent endonuclease of OLD family
MISSIYIKNFRSIKELELFPKSLSALLGPNSTGKTNVLKAIDLVLGEGWTTKAKIARELFNNPDEAIEIEITFKSPIKVPGAGYPTGDLDVSSIKLEMTLTPELSVNTTINGGAKFYAQEKFKKLCHFIYIPSQRDLADQMRVSGWTLLGKMMKEIHSNYISTYVGGEPQLKNDLKDRMQSAKDFIENDFDPTLVTFKKFVDSFKKHCQKNSIGLANKFEPELNIYNLNWFYKTLQIQVTENNDKIFDAEDLGSGLQNLILISIFQTYAELMGGKVIFGIEEPEIFLYPQAQRSLYESFQELSKVTQIFYTTHNPNFVSANRAHELEILHKNDELGTFVTDKDDTVITEPFLKEKQYQIYSHFNSHRNELFFAKKILLVEGPSDKILFETLAKEKWAIDLNKEGISIIDCTGKTGVLYFTGVCKLLGLDYLSVWDKDDEVTPTILAEAINSSNGLELDKDLETILQAKYTTLSFSSDSSKKIKQAYDWAISTMDWPSEFEQVRNFMIPTESEDKTTEDQDVFNVITIDEIPF